MRAWRGAIIVLAIAAGLWIGATSSRVRSWFDDLFSPTLPVAENASLTTNTHNVNQQANSNVPTNTQVLLPAEKNLNVPFTSQAPDANWDADHEEFCEEAAMLMVGRYYQGKPFASTADAESGLQQLKTWEVQHLGFYFDTTAEENVRVLKGMYNLQATALYDPTIRQLKEALAAGHPIIVPTAGRELGNPNFTAPGPIYHNLVLRGYTKDGKFITNDPGTRKGKEYLYDEDVLMAAIHNWVPNGDRTIAANGSVDTGRSVVLIVTP